MIYEYLCLNETAIRNVTMFVSKRRCHCLWIRRYRAIAFSMDDDHHGHLSAWMSRPINSALPWSRRHQSIIEQVTYQLDGVTVARWWVRISFSGGGEVSNPYHFVPANGSVTLVRSSMRIGPIRPPGRSNIVPTDQFDIWYSYSSASHLYYGSFS